jgi:hypothetical protein
MYGTKGIAAESRYANRTEYLLHFIRCQFMHCKSSHVLYCQTLVMHFPLPHALLIIECSVT